MSNGTPAATWEAHLGESTACGMDSTWWFDRVIGSCCIGFKATKDFLLELELVMVGKEWGMASPGCIGIGVRVFLKFLEVPQNDTLTGAEAVCNVR